MARTSKNFRIIKLPASRTEDAEFGGGKKGVMVCKTCGSYYYKKSWHHDAKGYMAQREEKTIPMKFVFCPACAMIRHGLYEGRVTIEHVPERFRSELEHLIKAYCTRAFERDPLDRLIGVQRKGDTTVVTVTENQLAAKLAKKIGDVFHNHTRVTITHSRAPSDAEFARVVFR